MVPSSAGLSISSFPSRMVAVCKPRSKAASRHARPRDRAYLARQWEQGPVMARYDKVYAYDATSVPI